MADGSDASSHRRYELPSAFWPTVTCLARKKVAVDSHSREQVCVYVSR
jgi:hypothetical protein